MRHLRITSTLGIECVTTPFSSLVTESPFIRRLRNLQCNRYLSQSWRSPMITAPGTPNRLVMLSRDMGGLCPPPGTLERPPGDLQVSIRVRRRTRGSFPSATLSWNEDLEIDKTRMKTIRKSRTTTMEENWRRTSYSEQSREPRKSTKT